MFDPGYNNITFQGNKSTGSTPPRSLSSEEVPAVSIPQWPRHFHVPVAFNAWYESLLYRSYRMRSTTIVHLNNSTQAPTFDPLPSSLHDLLAVWYTRGSVSTRRLVGLALVQSLIQPRYTQGLGYSIVRWMFGKVPRSGDGA